MMALFRWGVDTYSLWLSVLLGVVDKLESKFCPHRKQNQLCPCSSIKDASVFYQEVLSDANINFYIEKMRVNSFTVSDKVGIRFSCSSLTAAPHPWLLQNAVPMSPGGRFTLQPILFTVIIHNAKRSSQCKLIFQVINANVTHSAAWKISVGGDWTAGFCNLLNLWNFIFQRH